MNQVVVNPPLVVNPPPHHTHTGIQSATHSALMLICNVWRLDAKDLGIPLGQKRSIIILHCITVL